MTLIDHCASSFASIFYPFFIPNVKNQIRVITSNLHSLFDK
jgi:hypothetical protein